MAILIATLILPAFADFQEVVKGPNDLATLGPELETSKDQGPHSIRFDYYGNVGTFQFDLANTNIESLTFQRENSDSEAVINVATSFLDIKNLKGKVVLRGLAFQLMPNATLISGSDLTRPNGSLLIDSCFIFADTLDNTFLNWYADNASSIEFTNSYIVVGGSKTAQARMALTAGSVKFSNNLINYSGRISATGIAEEFQFLYNTVNRTQFELTGVVDVTQPRLEFIRNLFAHHGAKDSFNASSFFVVYHGLFDPERISLNGNKMYKTWNGFDYPISEKFDSGQTTNKRIDTIAGKPAGEKWNWYTETLDTNKTGLLSGGSKREKYNVLPQDSSFSWPTARGTLTATFQRAPYPRMISLGNNSPIISKLPPDSAFHRRIYPPAGTLHFGPFRIEKITVAAAAEYGKPTLLALSKDTLRAQAGNAAVKSNPSVYANALGHSRNFVLVQAGNTPSGADIRPGEGSLLSADDKLVFAKVDSAGTTFVKAPFTNDLPKHFRYLNVSLEVETNAVINSPVHVGVEAITAPYWPDSVFWLFRNPKDTLVPAVKPDSGPDTALYTASSSFSSAKGLLDAFLVEKLSVPAGGDTIEVKDGKIQISSTKGFQIKIDSGHVPNPLSYGNATKGYSFTWPFKAPTDAVILTLTKKPDHEFFVQIKNSNPDTLKGKVDTAGNFRIEITQNDTGKIFFAGIPYNVIKGNPPYNKVFAGGVNLTGFSSSTSGKLEYDSILDSEKRESLNSVVKVYRYLGGRQMRDISLETIMPSVPYGMSFAILSPKNAAKVEVYIHDGNEWLPSPHPGNHTGNPIGIVQVPIEARAVAVVERLESATTYIHDSIKVDGNTLYVLPTYRDSLKHITQYCVELVSVDKAGSVYAPPCEDKDKKEIGQPTTVQLLNAIYKMRIKYYMGPDPINGLEFKPIKDYGFNLENIVAQIPDVATRVAKEWSIVGFPVGGTFSELMKKQEFPDDYPVSLKKWDTTFVLRFHKKSVGDKKTAPFDTIQSWSALEIESGNAFLMASARAFKTDIKNDYGAHKMEPDTLDLDSGWNFVANPFPTNMLFSKIRSNMGDHILTFYGLDIERTGDVRKYRWKQDSTLRAFIGYAYHAQAGEKLIFDLLAEPSGELTKSAASIATTADLEARLESPWGASSMTFTSNPRRKSIPFLPIPGSGPQLRVGGGAGYMIKTLSRQDQIDEPMEIQSGAKGTVAFSLNRPFRTGLTMRLIDLESGQVFDEAEARALPVSEGTQRYQLLAGDAAFVESRIQAFVAAAPKEIELSQNYPNPFRGRTNVELRWPAWEGGERTGVLQVLDMQGRTVERMELGKIRVGRQVVTLDASRWQSGVYLYRLEVRAGSRRIHLQKRMLVTP